MLLQISVFYPQLAIIITPQTDLNQYIIYLVQYIELDVENMDYIPYVYIAILNDSKKLVRHYCYSSYVGYCLCLGKVSNEFRGFLVKNTQLNVSYDFCVFKKIDIYCVVLPLFSFCICITCSLWSSCSSFLTSGHVNTYNNHRHLELLGNLDRRNEMLLLQQYYAVMSYFHQRIQPQ